MSMCMKLLTGMFVAVFNIMVENSINLNINNKKILNCGLTHEMKHCNY